ncbi:MAG: hypothetical protein ACO1TE_27695 [Prosthecobacter sp.]
MTALLKKRWLLVFVPVLVFCWNMSYILAHKSPPALDPVADGPESHRVVRVYEGIRDIKGQGEWRSPLASLMLTVWVRDFDGWLHDRVKHYPNTFAAGVYSATQLDDYFRKEPKTRTLDERDRFNTWMRDSLAKVRLTIGSVVFETMEPDPVLTNSVKVQAQDANEHTWTRLAFCRLQPDGVESQKLKQLVQLHGSECSAPISIAFPFVDANKKPTYVAMGSLVNDGEALQTQKFSLPLRPRIMRALAWAALTAVMLFLVGVSLQTGVLRETVPPASDVIADWRTSPWSTSRVVFAWWLAICTACYLFLWAMQGSMNVLSGSAPLLLGINGGALLAASWVSDSKRKKAQTEAEAGAGAEADAADPTPIASRGFLTDIISEGRDAEVSKLQMLVWNGVLGVAFIWQSLSDWEMPTFNEHLMTLLGISATAYVGYKASK